MRLLPVIRRVLQRGVELDHRLALLERLPDERLRQRIAEGVRPDGAGFALHLCQLGDADIEGIYLNRDLTAGHRFAEEVVGLHRPLDLFARQIVWLLGGNRDLKLRQNVPLNTHRLLGLARREDGAQGEVPHIDFIGQHEIRRSDAEPGEGAFLLKDLVTARVLDLKRDRLIPDSLARCQVQRKGAEVHHLSRLIQRLVGGKQKLRRLLHLDRLNNRVFPCGGVYIHRKLIGSRLRIRRAKCGVYRAYFVRPALEKSGLPCRLPVLQPRGGYRDRGGNRLAGHMVRHHDPKRRRPVAQPASLAEHACLQRRHLVRGSLGGIHRVANDPMASGTGLRKRRRARYRNHKRRAQQRSH